MLENTELEIIKLAKQCHEGWLAAKRANGYVYGEKTDDVTKTNSNLVEWEMLDEETRNANIASARASYELVNKAGFKFVESISCINAFKKVAAKAIAKSLHEEWAKNKLENGWTYAPVTNKELKQHRDLCYMTGNCTYDEFIERYPEDAKYDFDTAYAILSGSTDNVPVPEDVYNKYLKDALTA